MSDINIEIVAGETVELQLNDQTTNIDIAVDNLNTTTEVIEIQFEGQGPAGPMGPAGPQGPAGADSTVPGPTGPQGIQGDPGPAGADGAPGPQGPAGADGATGPAGADGAAGPQGVPGPQGLTGAQGPAGADGPAGAPGPQGPQGIQGLTGPQGPAGADGATGPAGADSTVPGPQGPQGIQGLTGPAGPTGADGAQGPQGIQGLTGPTGPTGATGPAGADSTVPGPQGIQGETGPQGPTGATGPAGADSTVPGPKGDKGDTGAQGTAGADGATGPQGPQGIQGPAGADGAAGAKGDKGDQGIQGIQGPQGEPGATIASGVAFTPAGTIAATDVQAAIAELDSEVVHTSGNESASGIKTFTGDVVLQHASSTKLSTIAEGVSVSGNVVSASGMRIFATGNPDIASPKVAIGTQPNDAATTHAGMWIMGSRNASGAGIWWGSQTPSTTNMTLSCDGNTILNSPNTDGHIYLRSNNTTAADVGPGTLNVIGRLKENDLNVTADTKTDTASLTGRCIKLVDFVLPDTTNKYQWSCEVLLAGATTSAQQPYGTLHIIYANTQVVGTFTCFGGGTTTGIQFGYKGTPGMGNAMSFYARSTAAEPMKLILKLNNSDGGWVFPASSWENDVTLTGTFTNLTVANDVSDLVTRSGAQYITGAKSFQTGTTTFEAPVAVTTGKLNLNASAAAGAKLNIGAFGVTVTSPVDGDIWKSAADSLAIRMSTNTRTVAFLEKPQTFSGANTHSGVATFSASPVISSTTTSTTAGGYYRIANVGQVFYEGMARLTTGCIFRGTAQTVSSGTPGTALTFTATFGTNVIPASSLVVGSRLIMRFGIKKSATTYTAQLQITLGGNQIAYFIDDASSSSYYTVYTIETGVATTGTSAPLYTTIKSPYPEIGTNGAGGNIAISQTTVNTTIANTVAATYTLSTGTSTIITPLSIELV